MSNNSAHRWTPDVPMVVPEINPEHRGHRAPAPAPHGFIAVKAELLHSGVHPGAGRVEEFEPREVVVSTYQAISGAGKTFKDWPENGGQHHPVHLRRRGEVRRNR